ncbi:hypothetical protein ACA910_018380 [Epithemia clementina (nom. ined.)]
MRLHLAVATLWLSHQGGVTGQLTSHPTPSICNAEPSRRIIPMPPEGTPTGFPVTSSTTGVPTSNMVVETTGSPVKTSTASPVQTTTGSPTKSPVAVSTGSPTGSPTKTPTTGSPTGSPTKTPTTGSPTGSPSQAPVAVVPPPPGSVPTAEIVGPEPTETPTKAPIVPPISVPTVDIVGPEPTEAPTDAPIVPVPPPVDVLDITVEPPTETPTKSPIVTTTTTTTTAPTSNTVTTSTTTVSPTGLSLLAERCIACGDKSHLIEGEGKVTGGGWIYLTKQSYYNSNKVCMQNDLCGSGFLQVDGPDGHTPLDGKKAHFGFNAMYRKDVPYSSTNFGFDGGFFHFHSTTQNKPIKGLEVIDREHARWWGTGEIAATLNGKKSEFRCGFCFMVAVQDKGEPGLEDTWRLRIWQCTVTGAKSVMNLDDAAFLKLGDALDTLVFDNVYDPRGSTLAEFPLPSDMMTLNRFHGTELGDTGYGVGGGGNIQIHKPNARSATLDALIHKTPELCDCPAIKYEGDCSTGFVTGGGWIYLDNAYLAGYGNEVTGSNGLEGVKANFGFNAKAFHGVPTGSTNFDILGNSFHFKTNNAGQEYTELVVVCDDLEQGKGGNTVYARWQGVGMVSRTDDDSGWVNGYRFMVSVSDLGEPGYLDTFRLKIFEPNSNEILFDSFGRETDSCIFDNEPGCTGEKCKNMLSYEGSELGSLMENKKGGGNVVVHCKGGPNQCPKGMTANVAYLGNTPPVIVATPTNAPVMPAGSLVQFAPFTTDFTTMGGTACSGTSCTMGPYTCGGNFCAYTPNTYVTLKDNDGQLSSVYTKLEGLAGYATVTVYFWYKTTGFNDATNTFHLDYSYDADAATASFQTKNKYGKQASVKQFTETIVIDPPGQNSMILRFVSDTAVTSDAVYLTKVTVTAN